VDCALRPRRANLDPWLRLCLQLGDAEQKPITQKANVRLGNRDQRSCAPSDYYWRCPRATQGGTEKNWLKIINVHYPTDLCDTFKLGRCERCEILTCGALTGRGSRSYFLFRFAENDNEYTLLSIYISIVNAARTYPSFSATSPGR
jgi:hypothetical protein